ncbi:P22 phage major capsid protein family protein [Arthrobacter cavernae]|uniref:Uncharacterized protein n=1 Tax=Arthrobacter cavernae TaxID=2817681 RepID=A0A939HFS3_9MICC|nr:P22 phage major capsid protein family protein [Arthrobacter cavernae]MBO1267086.1 hypothetical protein [Arthrobacter cavernae]
MAQNYSAAHLSEIDERFTTESKVAPIINKGIRLDFNGKKSVTIYNVDVVAEVDYVRAGTNRFGTLIELGTGEQTFTLSQDKSFTFTVDRGNLNDSQMVQEAHKAVKRQVREVSIPNTDKYVLATLVAYAVANSQVDATGITNTTAYQKFLGLQASMDDAEVPADERVTFLTPGAHNLLKRDPEFIKSCDTAYKDLKKGIIGEVDGNTLIKVPTSWVPLKTNFLTVYTKVAVVPKKFDMVRVLEEVQGIDGAVAEGRRYYDAFIPKNKAKGIWVQKEA